MKSEKPFSVEDFLEKLAANDPEVALDPTVIAGLERLTAAVGGHQGARPLLLLIEDDDADAELLESALRQSGVLMEIVRVRDGQEAVDYFDGRGAFTDRRCFPLPHLTILDLKLPEVRGVEVLRHLRGLPDCAALIVIVLTATSPDQSDMNEIARLKASAFITKPDNLAAMAKVVQRVKASWIDGRRPRS